MITYNGKDYETRDITCVIDDIAFTVTIAKMELLRAISDDNWNIYPDAEYVDSQIGFYCDDEDWAKSDAELSNFYENL